MIVLICKQKKSNLNIILQNITKFGSNKKGSKVFLPTLLILQEFILLPRIFYTYNTGVSKVFRKTP